MGGNVEIHISSSDWYLHHHETDKRYDNVILHVVWDNNTPVFRADGTEVTVFILKNYVDADVLAKCDELFIRKPHFNCEKVISDVSSHIWMNWKEKLFLERLQEKIAPIQTLLNKTNNHWEHVFFCFLAKSFGLNANGEVFFDAVKNLPVLSVYKQSQSLLQIEALLFGVTGLLATEEEVEDSYVKELRREWTFLRHKYAIEEQSSSVIRFFQLRPPNFPTIRLAQLSSWLYHHQIPVHTMLNCVDVSYFYTLFDIKVSEYWETHYVFNKVSKKQTKKISRDFIDLLIINVVLPMQVAYKQVVALDAYDVSDVIDLALKIKAEKNTIITLFEQYQVTDENAVDSQAIVHLKKKYCDHGRCLECQIGKQYLKQK